MINKYLKNKKPLFTIATCSKSNFSELLQTCKSVKNFSDNFDYSISFEHILILSSYTSQEINFIKDIIQSYPNFVTTNIIKIAPKGISKSFNLCLELAHGNYLFFLNAGDKIKCDIDCLNSFKRIVKSNHSDELSNEKIVYYFDILTKGKTSLFNRRVNYPNSLSPYHFLKMGNPINHQATLYPLKLAKKYPYPNVLIGMDYSVNLNMIIDGIEFHKLPGIFVEYDITGISAKTPWKKLYENFKAFNLKAFKYRSFILIFLCWIILPFLIIRSFAQKVTYPLR